VPTLWTFSLATKRMEEATISYIMGKRTMHMEQQVTTMRRTHTIRRSSTMMRKMPAWAMTIRNIKNKWRRLI
jgi:hypothetical protein